MSMLCRGWAHIQNYSKAEILSQDRPGVAAQATFKLGLAAAAETVDSGMESGVVTGPREVGELVPDNEIAQLLSQKHHDM